MGLEAATIAYIAAAVSVGSAIYAASMVEDGGEAGASVTKQGTQNARNKVYGKAIVGTTAVYSNVLDRDSSYRLDVLAVGGVGKLRLHNIWIDDKKMFDIDRSFVSNPLSSVSGIYDKVSMRKPYQQSGGFKMQWRSGQADQLAANLAVTNSDGEWTHAHKGANVPHVVIYADYTTDLDYVIFGDRYDLKALVSAEDVYDPRTGLFNGASSNPALAIRDYLTSSYYGLGISAEYINDEAVINAANKCDIYGLEINSAIDGSASFSETLEDMLACFGGALAITNGKIDVLFEDAEPVDLYDFNEDNILTQSFKVSPASSSDYYNLVTTTFKSHINQERSDDYVIPADTTTDERIKQDGSIQSKTIDMPFTVDAYDGDGGEVRRAVKFITSREYKRAEFQTTCTFDVDLLEYPDLKVWSVVSVSHDVYGFNKKRFRVQSMETAIDEEQLNIATVHLVEYDDSIYLNDLTGSVVGKPLPTRPDSISIPTAVSFSLKSYVTDGFGVLSWAAGSFTNNVGYDIEYRLTDVTTPNTWVRRATRHKGTEFKFYNLKALEYDFRIRANDTVIGVSDWVELPKQLISIPYTLPAVTNVGVSVEGSAFVVHWDDMSDVSISNGTSPTDPDSAGVSGKVSDVFSHYEVAVFNGGVQQYTFTTTEVRYAYSKELNEDSPNGLSRNIEVAVSLVDKLGNKMQSLTVSALNPQLPAPQNVRITNTNGNSLIEWKPVEESDYLATEIHVSKTQGFTPSETTLLTTLGGDTTYLYNYDQNDLTKRYLRIAHYDRFGKSSMAFSPEYVLEYVGVKGLTYHYIKPLNGTALKNGEGSLTIEAHRAFEGNDVPITSGAIKLYVGGTEVGYSKAFTAADIDGSLVVELKDSPTGSVYDSITLIDVADGVIGEDGVSAIYGSIEASNGLTWVQAPDSADGTAGNWSPSLSNSTVTATFYQGGVAIKNKVITITRTADGVLSANAATGDTDVTVTVAGVNTPALSLTFTYEGVSVSEALAAISGAQKGEDGTATKLQFSVNGSTAWHDVPTTGDAYMRTCNKPIGGSWTCEGAVLVKGEDGESGQGVKVEFSENKSTWHDAPLNNDKYMRSCTRVGDGAWSCSGAVLIKGADGVSGSKGSKHYYVVGTSWSDSVATNFITVSQGEALVKWDVVTIHSQAAGFSVTKFWNGTAWESVGQVVDGQLLVNGSVRATAIDVDDLFAQNINATGIIRGAVLEGAKVSAVNSTSGVSVTLDSEALSPIVVNDGTKNVLEFDASKKLQLSAGLADRTIDNIDVFSDAIWQQIRPPLTEGSTGGAFYGADASNSTTLTSTVTMTKVNSNPIALACRFRDTGTGSSDPQWTLTITSVYRNTTGTGGWSSTQTHYSNYYRGDTHPITTGYDMSINFSEVAKTVGVAEGGDIKFTFTLTHNGGAFTAPSFTSISASQAVKGGGVAGEATTLDGKPSSYYLNWGNLTNKPTQYPAALTGNLLTAVPSGAKFTDTNTWRGVSDSVSSTSTGISASSKAVKIAYDKGVSAYNLASGKLGVNSKAVDSDKLDGLHASSFARTSGTYSGLRAQATTKADVGLSNVPNWSSGTFDGRYLGKSAKAVDADKLDGLHSTSFNSVVARYINTSSASTRLKIRLPFTTKSAKMLKFTVSLYAGYVMDTYEVSGYLYPSTNQWYSSKVIYSGTSSADIRMGRDTDGRAYVSIGGRSYAGCIVHSVTVGYSGSAADSVNTGWSITRDDACPNMASVPVYNTWHSGNDGSGSGLDADLLDGLHASSFARTSGTYSGLRAQATTKADVGLSNVPNWSSGTFDGRYLGKTANAVSASKWATGRTISLAGDASGAVSIDGSGNVTLPVTVKDDSHKHSQVYIPDTRGAARAPNYYPDRYVSFDFQQNTNTGAGDDTWHVVQTVAKWSSYDSSHSQQQLAFTGNNLKHREATSDSSWGAWKKVWDTGNDSPLAKIGSTNTFTGDNYFKGILALRAANGAYQRADARDDGSLARTHKYGKSTTGGTSNFREAWYDGSSYINITAESGGRLNVDKSLTVDGDVSVGGKVQGGQLGVTNTSSATGNGISLYGGSSSGQPTYGLMFAGTGTFGKHGKVTNDWATYLTMSSTSGRGWIFRAGTSNVASISTAGYATFARNYVGGASGFFFNDSGGRTAFTGGDLYIQTSVGTYYNYAKNQYHGNSSGCNHMFRGNALSGNGWNISTAGVVKAKATNGTVSRVLTYDDFLPSTPPAGLENTITAQWIGAGAINARHLQVNSLVNNGGTYTSFKVAPDASRPLSLSRTDSSGKEVAPIFYVDTKGNGFFDGKLSRDTVDIESIQDEARKQINPYYLGTVAGGSQSAPITLVSSGTAYTLPNVTVLGGKVNMSWKFSASDVYYSSGSSKGWVAPTWRVEVFRGSTSGTRIVNRTYSGAAYNVLDREPGQPISWEGGYSIHIEDQFTDLGASTSQRYVIRVTKVSGSGSTLHRNHFTAKSPAFKQLEVGFEYKTLFYNASGLDRGVISLSENYSNFEFLMVEGVDDGNWWAGASILPTKAIPSAMATRDDAFDIFSSGSLYWRAKPNGLRSFLHMSDNCRIKRIWGVRLKEKQF